MTAHIEEAEEIKEAARKIRDWCKGRPCAECPFSYGYLGLHCTFESRDFKNPSDWALD